MDLEFLAQLRRVALIEAVSTLVLFGLAVPLKYLAGFPLAVTLVGPVHGGLFLVFAVMSLMAVERVPMSRGLAAAAIVSAAIPFGPFVIDRRLAALSDSA
jgi:integral membrane protein